MPGLTSMPLRATPFRVGVAGHRYLSPAAATFTESCILGLLSAARSLPRGARAVTALAQGSDTIFARIALALGIPFTFVSPHLGYELDADGLVHADCVGRIAPLAVERIQLPFAGPSAHAHLACMEYVAETSDLLLAVWNGQRNTGLRATEHAIRCAQRLGRPWLHLDVSALCVRPSVPARASDLRVFRAGAGAVAAFLREVPR